MSLGPTTDGRGLCLGLLLSILLLAMASESFALEPKEAFLKGPYLQGPAQTTMTIMWESATNGPGIVRYGLTGKMDQEFRSDQPQSFKVSYKASVTNIDAEGKKKVTTVSVSNMVHLHEVTLTNLKPASVYTYSVEMAGVQSAPKNFKTFGPNPAKVTFIAYGDTRTFPKMHSNIVQNFKRFSPDFILHTGDLVDSGKKYEVWGKEFFAPLASVIDEVPLFAVIGNHEDDGTNFFRYLHLPGTERWYSFNLGPLHVLCLDFRFSSPRRTNEQLRFAREDLLRSKAPWKMVMVHYPVYNVGGHDMAWGHKAYLPVFHEAKVDVVIAGHSHLYERFRPIVPKDSPGSSPIIHITTGGGGAELATSHPHPALAARASTNHYVVFEVSRDILRGQAYTAFGKTIDSFEFRKIGGGWPDDFVAQAYSEELLYASIEAATNLVARFAAVPATNTPGPAMFTIRPLNSDARPVKMAISLTPASAAYYELLGNPLEVTTPAGAESNKILWAQVLATGKKKVSGSPGNDLSPSLVFQAEVSTEHGTTLAHGQKCKVSSTAAEAAKKLAEARSGKMD